MLELVAFLLWQLQLVGYKDLKVYQIVQSLNIAENVTKGALSACDESTDALRIFLSEHSQP